MTNRRNRWNLLKQRTLVFLLSACLVVTMGVLPERSLAADADQQEAAQAQTAEQTVAGAEAEQTLPADGTAAPTEAPQAPAQTPAPAAQTAAPEVQAPAAQAPAPQEPAAVQTEETQAPAAASAEEAPAEPAQTEVQTEAAKAGEITDLTTDLVGRNISEAETDPQLAELLDDPEFSQYYVVDENGVIRMNKAAAGTGLTQGLVSASIPSRYKSGYDVQRCIDISAWQGAVTTSEFKQIRALGINRVIVRVGYSSIAYGDLKRNTDKYYKTNISNAYAAGMTVGAYYFSQAKNVSEAKKEASYTLSLLSSYRSKIKMPVVFDYEFNTRLNSSVAKKLGKNGVANVAIAFCDAVKSAGYKPMYYASASVLCNYVNRDTIHSRYLVWLAHYTSGGKATDYSRPVYAWQYSSSGRLRNAKTGDSIISGRVDMNYVFVKKSSASKTPSSSSSSGNGWVKQSNGKYKYKSNGQWLRSRWLNVSGNVYYLDSEGYRLTGYQKIGQYYYGFDSNGVRYHGTKVKIGGKKRTFLKSGIAVIQKAKTTGSLNYRTGPGTQYAKKGSYKKGKKVKVIRKCGKWRQLSNKYWVSGKYLK